MRASHPLRYYKGRLAGMPGRLGKRSGVLPISRRLLGWGVGVGATYGGVRVGLAKGVAVGLGVEVGAGAAGPPMLSATPMPMASKPATPMVLITTMGTNRFIRSIAFRIKSES